ncbi:hypothetical protein GCM10011376_15330 [Nocardioides flavus (ex Wang et al. 2016)]|uniref:Uncharacterized protein n=1 Tax=Nocardioides flavus (ex Wang et al. 2016) TaxID=2058780 RepID=A0ABQ3HJ51_9ACTN|nr:hypothetical protein [Nocardioides flavus (ex Wang et al. 2016)]GHE16923.1 hypothetical protein GCM10011376_15330 [Nocardioides flavus (ex Wang et al. 2016)]
MPSFEDAWTKPPQGWLVACVMAALFVLMGASGDDVFARHVGMSASSSELLAESSGVGAATATTERPGDRATAGVAPVHGTGDTTVDGRGAAHVLHLLGACVAVLVAGVLLLRARGLCRWARRATSALSPRVALPAPWLAGLRRGPPRLSPPRSSPVIRT